MKKAIQVLNDLKREGLIKEYAIGGGRAILFYAEPVQTQDLDVFIFLQESDVNSLAPLSRIYDALRKYGYQEKGEAVVIDGIPVQFLVFNDDLYNEALEEAFTRHDFDVPTRVIRPEHLIAIALKTGRARDKLKVIHLYEQAPMSNDYLNSVLERYNLKDEYEKWIR